ncbi:fad fmn-binding protein [Chrysochromulina tobinii]|uniref:Fad fmn-binding protein n=1 Tax=Chrysochromulina tobinii TaxID=1460289 RepID=A0A0M0J4D0_9EUKA|nr:fad fmn-binding protein [Chrysochromulina tobinii]|eukprot:KOO21088.1 fad fmn-binding protein [Chrysochromulina sp. CCMP291]
MDVFSPLTLPCGLCLKNRLLRAAAFSGETVPAAAETLGEAARGGCALVTLAYTSVSADGRTFPSQFVLSEASAPPAIAAAVHAGGALFSVQLTHAGSFASRALLPAGSRGPVAPSAVFDLPALGWSAAATEADMARLLSDFAAAAAFAALLVKLNTADGFGGGVAPADVAETVRALAGERGLVDGLVPSAGWVNRNGFFMLRGAVPRRGMVAALARSSAAKALAMALLGKWLVPELPFEPRFLAEGARAVLAEARGVPVFAVGGYVALEAVAAALGEGFAGVQMARALIREPDLPKSRAAATATGASSLPSRPPPPRDRATLSRGLRRLNKSFEKSEVELREQIAQKTGKAIASHWEVARPSLDEVHAEVSALVSWRLPPEQPALDDVRLAASEFAATLGISAEEARDSHVSTVATSANVIAAKADARADEISRMRSEIAAAAASVSEAAAASDRRLAAVRGEAQATAARLSEALKGPP